jgi:Leucine-rich repeat (LRR) protein
MSLKDLTFLQFTKCGHSLLSLMNVALVLSFQTSQAHVLRYTMHDLVHDLARLTMADKLIVFDVAPQRNKHAYKYCHYSLLRKFDQTMKLANMPSKLRALRFSDSGGLLDIPSGAFSFAKCLRTLDFSECSGIMLPASIGRMKQLRCLIAPRMQNDSLPECITELSKLQYLSLNGSTQISALPESIGKLERLRYICFSGCSGISELPKSFGDLKSMVRLDMSGCSGIRELPESFGDLKSMVHLDMSGCSGIRELPESFGDLKSMVHLDMSGCSGIRELPESFGDLNSMVHLDMSGCSGLTELPDSIGNLTHLRHLQLSGCSSLPELPDTLGKLTNLQHLELSGCSSVKAIPEPLCGLRQLQCFNMSRCEQIRELPETLMKLENLLHLDLSRCSSLQHLGGVRDLTALQHLDLSRSWKIGLQDLSGILANLTNLKYLGLSRVIISRKIGRIVSHWIGGMTNLEHLDLSWNVGLECLPASIGNLQRLQTLDLTACRGLKSLPESIRALGLKSLVLDSCSNELVDQASSLVHFSKSLPDFKVRADDVNGCSNFHLLEGINVSELRIRCLENVSSLEEANKVKLSRKCKFSRRSK